MTFFSFIFLAGFESFIPDALNSPFNGIFINNEAFKEGDRLCSLDARPTLVTFERAAH